MRSSQHRSLRRSLAALLAAAPLLAGCNVWQDRAEFAPPQSRWPNTQPSAVKADAMPPPIPISHCYRTLATVDCFATPQPDRASGYTGTYPTP
ncbi:MAG TPA: hypothetical protein VGD08_11315 [Stellaceae bacterium]|jgi:hypothetical protein